MINGQTYVLEQNFDALDRVTSETLPDGDVVTYTYNNAGWLDGIPNFIDAISYSAQGQVTQIDYANGRVSTRSYDEVAGLVWRIRGVGFPLIRTMRFAPCQPQCC